MLTHYCTTNTPWDGKHFLYPHHLKPSSPEPEDSKHCKHIYTLFPYLEHNCWTSRIFPLMRCCTQETKVRSRCFRLIRGFSWFSHLLLHCRWLHYHCTHLFHNRQLWDLLISVVRQGPLKQLLKLNTATCWWKDRDTHLTWIPPTTLYSQWPLKKIYEYKDGDHNWSFLREETYFISVFNLRCPVSQLINTLIEFNRRLFLKEEKCFQVKYAISWLGI